MTDNDAATISFQDALTFVLRGFLPALIIATVCAAAAWLISRNPTPVYRATAVLLATRPNSGYSDSATIIEPAQLDPDIYRSAVVEGGLMESSLAAVLGERPSEEELTAWRRAISVRVDEGLISGLVRIEVDHNNPGLAREVANAIYQSLLGWDRDRVIMNVQETVASLRRSVLLIGAQLLAAEQAGNEDDAQVLRATRDSRQTQLRQAETLSLSVVAIGLLEPFSAAVVDPMPVNDRTTFITAVAFVLGFIAMYIIRFLVAAANPRVRNAAEIHARTGFQPILVLPNEGKRQEFAAAVERLAVALQRLKSKPTAASDEVGTNGLTISVMSPTTPEEKSLLAVYLARSFVRAGWRVLLVDADLKNAVTSRALPSPRGGPTVAELLQKGHTGQIASKLPGLANLEYIPAGTGAVSGSAVTFARRLPSLIDLWRARFDVVIIDTAPTAVAPDAYSLADSVDATVIVTKANITPLDAPRQVMDALEQAGVQSLHTVLAMGGRARKSKDEATLSREWSDQRANPAPEARARVVSRPRGGD